MGDALAQPSFQAAPTPVSLLIDFDGTISLLDVGDVLLSSLVDDQDAVRHMDQLYHEGRKGSRELTAWDIEVLPHDAARLHEVVDGLPLDDTFADLVAVVLGSGAAVEIVSDGLGFHVERMLARLDLADLPVATNATVLGPGGAGVSFPYGHPVCLVCGTCKRERVRLHQAAGRAVIFVGDGPSDRYAAQHADVVFAKWSLERWCREPGHRPTSPGSASPTWPTWFERALGDGRLPAVPADYDGLGGPPPGAGLVHLRPGGLGRRAHGLAGPAVTGGRRTAVGRPMETPRPPWLHWRPRSPAAHGGRSRWLLARSSCSGTRKGAFILELDGRARSSACAVPSARPCPSSTSPGIPARGALLAAAGSPWYGPLVWRSDGPG